MVETPSYSEIRLMASHIFFFFFFSNTHAALLIKLCTLSNPVHCTNVVEGSVTPEMGEEYARVKINDEDE